MRRKLRCAGRGKPPLATLLALLSCAAVLVAADGEAVVVTSNARDRETTYTTASGTCRISWTVYDSEANRGVVRHRAECSLPFPEQVPLMARVMRKVLENTPGTSRTLFWGRLYPDGRPDPVLAMRLAAAAKRSPLWDAARGRARNGDANGLVRKLANDAVIYAELRESFREAGLDIILATVEKVLVVPAGQLPFFGRFPRGEIKPADRLPYDCMAWFSISKR